jgi:hypothetical protein
MADNSYNLIKSVDNNQNVIGLTPAKSREERKKRQNMDKQQNRQQELAKDELNEPAKEKIDSKIAENDQDKRSIDYCA